MAAPVIVIPAYRPSERLASLATELKGRGYPVVVVDDGSGPEYSQVFALCSGAATVVRHPENRGKDAALRTGMKRARRLHPDAPGVITADGDGQHHADHIAAVANRLAERPRSLVLGPPEAQTGLSGIPSTAIPGLLETASTGSAFELDMLHFARERGIPVCEAPIGRDGQRDDRLSGLRTLSDSPKAHYVLFRFALLSMTSTILDNLVFLPLFLLSGRVALSQAVGRFCGASFNYVMSREAVFLSREAHRRSLPRYAAVAAASGIASYALLQALRATLGWNVYVSKLTADSILFGVNFLLQKDFVFSLRRRRRILA